ncbi:MAG: GAF domain-containing protein, partial [Spirochaetota bacterium]
NDIYLRNLRLWQLITLCNIANITEELKKKTQVALDTTHLLVIQDMPITVTFDFEEKGFRVEGAYNIRYEIIKKRIDKAVISGTGERLTQPRKLAMVYSQQKERNEYIRYIDYLISRGYLEDGIEELDLDDLQGVRGLKALRTGITVRDDLINRPVREIIDAAFIQ